MRTFTTVLYADVIVVVVVVVIRALGVYDSRLLSFVGRH